MAARRDVGIFIRYTNCRKYIYIYIYNMYIYIYLFIYMYAHIYTQARNGQDVPKRS